MGVTVSMGRVRVSPPDPTRKRGGSGPPSGGELSGSTYPSSRSVRRTPLAALLMGLWLGGCMSSAPPEARIDGELAEWDDAPVVVSDPADAPDAEVDFREVRALHDEGWLYLGVDWERRAAPQSHLGTTRLVLDADGDPSTGGTVDGLDGTDLVVILSRQDLDLPGGYGAGVGVQAVSETGVGDVLAGDLIGLVIAPTFSSSRFELRMRRGAALPGGVPLFTGPSVRLGITLEDPRGERDRTDVGTYVLDSPPAPTPTPGASLGAVTKAEGDVRVVVWNVADDGPQEHGAEVARVMGAIRPDVVMWDEVWRTVTPDDVRALLASVPGEGEWNVHLADGGGRQKTVVASRLPVRAAEGMERIDYPEEQARPLVEEAGLPAPLIEREFGEGIPATGAWVDVGGTEVLFVPFDLQSAGYDGSWQDRMRSVQATAIVEAVDAALAGAPAGSPVVLGGDANLVGSETPLTILEGQTRRRVDAHRLGDGTLSTWRNPAQALFTPGRLDFLVYGGTGLELTGSFVFEPSELDEEARRALGVEATDAESVSDHIPVVADFRIR